MKILKKGWPARYLLRLVCVGLLLEILSRYWRGFGLAPGVEVDWSATIAGSVYAIVIAIAYPFASRFATSAWIAGERRWRNALEGMEDRSNNNVIE